MCTRHSFLLDKEGRIYDGRGLTHSHTEIATMHGFKSSKHDKLNAYEWQPPKGWPNALWLDGLTVDRQNFEPKSSHDKAMKSYLTEKFPTLAAWDAPEAVDPALNGQTITLSGTERTVYCYGQYAVTEGVYLICGTASGTAGGTAELSVRGNASVSGVGGNASVSGVWGNASVAPHPVYGENVTIDGLSGNAVVIDRMGGGITIYAAVPVEVVDVSA
jgi:hypothetical protein